jgi:predicted HAD superfamily Cof-like phosphohydrolase
MERTSPHYERVREFMRMAKQGTPDRIGLPDEATRLLRARLIHEEATETIHALGCSVNPAGNVMFDYRYKPDLIGIVDGCADVSVVTIGTLIACGVPDGALLQMVDVNNLAKFGEGHSFRPDGKLVKPPNHKPPAIAGLLKYLSSGDPA